MSHEDSVTFSSKCNEKFLNFSYIFLFDMNFKKLTVGLRFLGSIPNSTGTWPNELP